jgi:hypothetical protein
MKSRKLLIALATAGFATAGFGAAVLPADADPRTFQIKLATGQTVTVTVDVPPGTPVSSIQFPGINAAGIVSVTEVTPPPSAQPGVQVETAPQQAPPPQQPAPSKPKPGSGGGDSNQPSGGSGGGEPKASKGGAQQRTTGRTRRTESGEIIPDGLADQMLDEDAKREGGTSRRGTRLREPGGAPAIGNPTLSIATPGAAPIGVPNFFIEKFRIPPFLLSIYQAAGIEYGVRWEVLAAINEVETDYGRNLNVSTAGALGWMQFMPATWKQYGVDANGDKKKDPYNPVDAIFAAARYLKAAGADEDLRRAIFAYNHADWYVDMVLMRARLIGGLPANLVGSLTGLTQGMFPVYATARYADDLSESETSKRVKKGTNAALPVEADTSRRGINIYAKPGSPVIATQDGRVVKIGNHERLGRFIQVRDVYGNTYTYGHLGKLAKVHAVPKARSVSKAQVVKELKLPRRDPKPTLAASAGTQKKNAPTPSSTKTDVAKAPEKLPAVRKERLFAAPKRPAAFKAGGREQLLDEGILGGVTTFKRYFVKDFGLDKDDVVLKHLKVGSKVIGGTILGRIGKQRDGASPHVLFEIRPAGRGAPRIDPKPILDGWKLLETTAIYRAKGKNPFFGRDARTPTIGQILLMGKTELENRVLENPRIEIYGCGRRDVRGSSIDRRVLATLEFLAANGLRPTVTSLKCGHSFFTASGNVSHHSSGNAVDIAKLNGTPILGHQGEGSITDIAVRRLLTLQGTMKPAQIITLMKYEGTDNTYAMGDHHDHIHVGFQPMYDANSKLGRQLNAVLKPGQWIKLIDRLGEIDNPTVRVKPSKYAITVKPDRASLTHRGE